MVDAHTALKRGGNPRRSMKSKVILAILSVLPGVLLAGGLPAQAPPSDQPANASQPAQAAPADQAGSGSQTAPADATAPATAPAGTKPHDDSFVIGDDDMLSINVWKEPDVSKSVPVRSDGKISLPLVGEVVAAGQTPLQLEQVIAARLLNYMTDPQVTVIVQQINSQKYNILGQVAKPGAYSLTVTTTIVDAIAAAGGFKDFAKKKRLYILRQNPAGGEARIDFNYQDFIKGKNANQNIVLKPHDTVIVP
jgi:polysaccharide export outer membrane protein